MIKHSFLKPILLALTIIVFASCDNDFNLLGTNLVGVDNFGFGTPVTYNVTTTNVDLGAVESTDLAVNPLGIYENPVFGETTANFVTQVLLATDNINPTIDLTKDPQIVSVVLRIPYFTKSTAVPYTLDSIYGHKPYTPMKLSVYESGYFLRNLNPAEQSAQAYYTDQNQLFEQAKIPGRLNDDSDANQNDGFHFNSSVSTKTTYDADGIPTTTTDAAPAITLNLSHDRFKDIILHAPAGKLINNNVFVDYFRGLYFKIEKSGSSQGNLAMLNFKAGTITVYYRQNLTLPTEEHPIPKQIYKSIILNLTGKSVSLIEQGNRVAPDSGEMYLKGGANGSMAVVDIDSSDIKQMRDSKWLINDASITFNINKAKMDLLNSYGRKADEPMRVYLYDLNNKRQLADYTLDQTASSNSVKFNKYIFGGTIKREAVAADGGTRRGLSYKLRITNHLRNLINIDTITNVRLGLIVTETISDVASNGTRRLKNQVLAANNPNSPNSSIIKAIPTMAVPHPLGTVLFGSDAAEDKRPKLQVYYTQQKQN